MLRFERMGTRAAFQYFYIMRRVEMITFSFLFFFILLSHVIRNVLFLDEKCHVMFDVLFSCFLRILVAVSFFILSVSFGHSCRTKRMCAAGVSSDVEMRKL